MRLFFSSSSSSFLSPSQFHSAPPCPFLPTSRLWTGLENESITIEEAIEVLETLKEVGCSLSSHVAAQHSHRTHI